ncbi:hypothetical protein PC128_g19272 [Phytophthora cactorum]|nr:hypothetical protein PC128_g19272 [Phytophthora cactorum]KAG4038092.1 hypothetical protein PC123_g26347 [Phytophthora cactorum]
MPAGKKSSAAEKHLVEKTYEYIHTKKVAEPKQWKKEARNHVSECLVFAPSTISAICSPWETNHDPTFASAIGPKPAGRRRKFGESLHPLVRKLVSEMNKSGKPVAASAVIATGATADEYEYLMKKMANLNSRNFPVRPEVFLDETFCNLHHVAQLSWVDEDKVRFSKSGRGPRLCIVAAGTIRREKKRNCW